MATLETSSKANRRTERQNDKATYRGSSYRFAQKQMKLIEFNTNNTLHYRDMVSVVNFGFGGVAGV